MKIYEDGTVLEKSKERIRWLFDEFDEVVVNVSGGKDSQVVYNLAYDVAEELGELPIYVLWIDQEAEYKATGEIVERWMSRDGIEPLWMQIPMKMTNATSDEDNFLEVWDPDADTWVREKSDISIKKNTYGTERFSSIFEEVLVQEVVEANDGAKTVTLGGVRTEESPARYMGLTYYNTYKGLTYGSKDGSDRNLWRIHPIYDWDYTDVWKYIFDNDLEYNKVYDYQFQEGKDIRRMRVSNLNHETAVDNLLTLKQYEPETYNKLLTRLDGINSATELGDDYFPDDLPYMFESWREYRNYLLEELVDNEKHKLEFQKTFFRHDIRAEHADGYSQIVKAHVNAILANDWEGESILNNIRRDINDYNTPGWREMRDAKIEWLKENGHWAGLQEKGIVE